MEENSPKMKELIGQFKWAFQVQGAVINIYQYYT